MAVIAFKSLFPGVWLFPEKFGSTLQAFLLLIKTPTTKTSGQLKFKTVKLVVGIVWPNIWTNGIFN